MSANHSDDAYKKYRRAERKVAKIGNKPSFSDIRLHKKLQKAQLVASSSAATLIKRPPNIVCAKIRLASKATKTQSKQMAPKNKNQQAATAPPMPSVNNR